MENAKSWPEVDMKARKCENAKVESAEMRKRESAKVRECEARSGHENAIGERMRKPFD